LDLPSKPIVVVCGRRKERLEELVVAHHATGRLKSVTLDVLSERNALKSSIEDIINTYPNVCAPSTIPCKPADPLFSLTLSCSRVAFNVASTSRGQRPLISTVGLSRCAIVMY
jgi:hypothetical protein